MFNEDNSTCMEIDHDREITVSPTADGTSVVVMMMDVQGAAVIQMSMEHVDTLIAALQKARNTNGA